MGNPVASHKVFLLDLPYIHRKIREVTAVIVVCDKTTWAEVDERHGPRRYLLGSSAFYTRAAAEKRKLAELQKTVARGRFNLHGAAERYDVSRAQLAEYEATGTVH